MRVWIDQDLCTGDGLCVDHCPDAFVQLEDGIAYVAERGVALNDPGSSGSLASVESRDVIAVVQAAEMCPGECIFIEIDEQEIVSGLTSGKLRDQISVP
ncbi:MAG: ferredoxin [Actinobacteria bacterium]|nr:MAG: ferredoxin [Actinomycetota bacterium]